MHSFSHCSKEQVQLVSCEVVLYSLYEHTYILKMYEDHPESKERLRIQSVHLFCCSWSLVSGVQCNVESCFMQLCVGPCQVVSGAEIAMAMEVPIENLADFEMWGVTRFLQTDEILDYLAEEASSHVELFCCTTMHVNILPGRHKPCCVRNSIGTSSSILHTFQTWHCRTFSCFQKYRSIFQVNILKNLVGGQMVWRGYTQTGAKGMTSVLMSKTTMWNSRQRYMPKRVYSVSVLLLLKNILVCETFFTFWRPSYYWKKHCMAEQGENLDVDFLATQFCVEKQY